jgi:hypothetical protein
MSPGAGYGADRGTGWVSLGLLAGERASPQNLEGQQGIFTASVADLRYLSRLVLHRLQPDCFNLQIQSVSKKQCMSQSSLVKPSWHEEG